nr:mycothiol synthase [Streptosporangiaceae bacterium]
MTADGGRAGQPDSGDSGQIQIQTGGTLSPSEAAAVLELVSAAADADGVSPLSEHVMLHLRYGGDSRAHDVLLWYEGTLAGYGHLDPTDRVEGPAGEMVIRPAARRRGFGRALGQALVASAGRAGVQLWAHGDLPAAARLAAAVGFHRSRALWQMRRSLRTSLAEPRLPDGISIRTFRVGLDEDAWLGLNRRAFARHPEQGGWTRADLEVREREPWFDADGFFLAERAGRLAGFHWTKVHSGQSSGPPPDSHDGKPTAAAAPAAVGAAGAEPIGEVYVVGVDPDEQGTGLGRALTLIGLQHLRGKGLAEVMLYVDETNTAAIALYRALGFAHTGTDVMFSRGGREPAR